LVWDVAKLEGGGVGYECGFSILSTVMKDEELIISIKNANPKKGAAQTYDIRTLQDITDCVTSENIEGFLVDFECVLRAHILIRALTAEKAQKGEIHEDSIIVFESFEWIDDNEQK
jgi:hypothetical protein